MSTKTRKYFIIVLLSVYAAYVFHSLSGGAVNYAWPKLRVNLQIPDSGLGYITAIIAFFTVLTCLLLNRIFPNVKITIKVITGILLQVISLIGTVLSKNFLSVFLFAIPLGIGSGILEVVLNAYSSTHFTAKYTNYLHLFHSMGGIFGPYLMSLAFLHNGNTGTWQRGYIYLIFVQIIITFYVFLSIPKWEKIPLKFNSNEVKKKTSFIRLFKMNTLRITLLYSVLLNAVEYVVGTWLCTYLVDAKSLKESDASAKCVILTVGLCLGRFLSGLLSDKIKTWNRIRVSTVLLMVGIVVFTLPLP
ncbi:MAG: MFS transporter, partial [Clostridia bacterium]|nr:MFS transporter [Clostridia bacterium]